MVAIKAPGLSHGDSYLLADLGCLTDRDTLMLADQARNVMRQGQRLLPSGSSDGPQGEIYGFSLAERVASLGYQLTRKQQAALYGPLGKQLAKEWTQRYPGRKPSTEPRQVDGAVREVRWYPSSEASWVDPIIQAFFAGFPGLLQSSKEEPLP